MIEILVESNSSLLERSHAILFSLRGKMNKKNKTFRTNNVIFDKT